MRKLAIPQVFADLITGLGGWFGLDRTINSWVQKSGHTEEMANNILTDIAKRTAKINNLKEKYSTILDDLKNAGFYISGNTASGISAAIDRVQKKLKEVNSTANSLDLVETRLENSANAIRDTSLGDVAGGQFGETIDKIMKDEKEANDAIQRLEKRL